MGLDTVELVYSFEQCFSLDIPDPVCEKLYTVADVAACISEQLGVAGLRYSAARELVQRQLSELLELPPGAFNEVITVQQFLPDAESVVRLRQQLANRYGSVDPNSASSRWLSWRNLRSSRSC